MDDLQYNLLTLFADGGPMMYILVLFSLVALGVIIAKSWTLWVAHRDTERILEEVEELTHRGEIDEAIRRCAATPGPTSAILMIGLRRIREGQVQERELEQVINTTGAIELGFLERGLVILATVANVAPLLGFLGTVAGMIMAFASIEAAGDVNPTMVAGGIKVALLTTATGLLIAIPTNIGYNFFVTRIDKLIVDMEQGTQQVLNLVWDLEKEGRVEVAQSHSVPHRPSAEAVRRAWPDPGSTPVSPPAPPPDDSDVKDGPGD